MSSLAIWRIRGGHSISLVGKRDITSSIPDCYPFLTRWYYQIEHVCPTTGELCVYFTLNWGNVKIYLDRLGNNVGCLVSAIGYSHSQPISGSWKMQERYLANFEGLYRHFWPVKSILFFSDRGS